jgi:hypothetical protein
MPSRLKQVNFRVNFETWDLLRKLSAARGQSIGQYVRDRLDLNECRQEFELQQRQRENSEDLPDPQ